MKNLSFLFSCSLFLFLLFSCSKEPQPTISYNPDPTDQKILAKNIVSKVPFKADDGIVLAFDTTDVQQVYSNVIGLIPENKSDIDRIYKVLNSDKISFVYHLDDIEIIGNGVVKLIVANEHQVDVIENLMKTKDNVIPMIQISYLKKQNFDIEALNDTKRPGYDNVNSMINIGAGVGTSCD